MKNRKNKPRPPRIGRRTKKDVLQGKLIRRREDGTDVFEDYWTDGESVHSNQTTSTLASPNKDRSNQTLTNTSILDGSALPPVKLLRSSVKKTLNEKSEDNDDYGSDSSSEQSRRSGISRKESFHVPKNLHNTTIGLSKTTQTSLLLAEKDSSAKNRTLKKIQKNNESDKSSPKTNLIRDLSDTTDTQNTIKDLPMSKQPISTDSVSLPYETRSRKSSKSKSSIKTVRTRSSHSRSGTFKKTSHLRETREKLTDSSDSETSLTTRSSSVLSDTSYSPHGSERHNERNYSVGKSPQHAAKFLEVLKLKDFIHSKSDSILNRSEILASVPKEVEAMEGKRKSSLVKSPIALNRKIHTPNALEKSLSDTVHVENRQFDNSDKNFSGMTFSQQGAKSKEGKRKSSLAKSPVALNRKIHPPNALEKSLSDTAHVQNREGDNSEKNFSGMTSSQQGAKSKEALNQEEKESGKKPKAKNNSRTESSLSNSGMYASLRETGRKITYSERSVSLRRSVVLSNNSKSPYIKEKENRRNISAGSSPRHVEKSSEVPKSKEVENSRSYKSLNRTEISQQKESKEIEGKRKSSIGKSPIPVKRKIQALNALENSKSKTANVQNKVKRKSSEDRYSEHEAMFSEVHNQKECSPSKSDKSVESSNFFADNQKENEPNSDIEMAPRRSECNRMEVSNSGESQPNALSPVHSNSGESQSKAVSPVLSNRSESQSKALSPVHSNSGESQLKAVSPVQSDRGESQSKALSPVQSNSGESQSKSLSPVNSNSGESQSKAVLPVQSNNGESQSKAISPVGSARRKIDFSETKKRVLKNKKRSLSDVRRSSRVRFPPLASWRNERPKFEISSSGELNCVGLDKGRPEDDFGLRYIQRMQNYQRGVYEELKKAKKKSKKPTNINKLIGKTTITNGNTGEELELYLHRPFNTYEWTLPPNEENPRYMISQVFSSNLITFGFVDIASQSVKDPRMSPTDNAQFVVVKGEVEVKINTSEFNFKKGDSFIVPAGTMYSITNRTFSNALLHFCAFKIPFFNYQNA